MAGKWQPNGDHLARPQNPIDHASHCAEKGTMKYKYTNKYKLPIVPFDHAPLYLCRTSWSTIVKELIEAEPFEQSIVGGGFHWSQRCHYL